VVVRYFLDEGVRLLCLRVLQFVRLVLLEQVDRGVLRRSRHFVAKLVHQQRRQQHRALVQVVVGGFVYAHLRVQKDLIER
jgi:hypothetical protein